MAEKGRSGSSILPDFLYKANSLALLPDYGRLAHAGSSPSYGGILAAPGAGSASSAPAAKAMAGGIFAAAPSEGIKLYSSDYYLACAVGGMLCCGLTHAAVTPIDVVKCNMQIDNAKYPSITTGFRVVVQENGARGLFKGITPTLLGYSAQGAFKYGFYEYFKKKYSDLVGPENAKNYKTLIYLAGSASAEVIADVALCPLEAVKVRLQTQPGFAVGLRDALPKIVGAEGVAGLYKGLVPLWGRQIPYTMMKFGTFENTVEALYKHVLPRPKEQCTKGEQLGVSFLGGYIAGVACAIVSHPADNLVSFLNNAKNATVKQAIDTMGMKALFTRGLSIRIIMVGTLTGAQWGIYDAWKVACGLPTTGGTSVQEEQHD